mgnify:FL=1
MQFIITPFAKDITHYFLWNSNCGQTTLKEMEASIASRKGTGGTSPEHVASTIVNAGFRNIILVTDGEVGDGSVQSCDRQF